MCRRPVSYPPNVKELLLGVYGSRCVWCAKELTIKSATADHILCVSAGGSDWIGNLLPSCRPCNCQRSNKDAGSWLQSCRDRGRKIDLAMLKRVLKANRLDPRAKHAHFQQYQIQRNYRLAEEQLRQKNAEKRNRHKTSLKYLKKCAAFALLATNGDPNLPFNYKGTLIRRAHGLF